MWGNWRVFGAWKTNCNAKKRKPRSNKIRYLTKLSAQKTTLLNKGSTVTSLSTHFPDWKSWRETRMEEYTCIPLSVAMQSEPWAHVHAHIFSTFQSCARTLFAFSEKPQNVLSYIYGFEIWKDAQEQWWVSACLSNSCTESEK